MKEYNFIPYQAKQFSEEEMLQKSIDFYEYMNIRRTVRDFSDKPILKKLKNYHK